MKKRRREAKRGKGSKQAGNGGKERGKKLDRKKLNSPKKDNVLAYRYF